MKRWGQRRLLSLLLGLVVVGAAAAAIALIVGGETSHAPGVVVHLGGTSPGDVRAEEASIEAMRRASRKMPRLTPLALGESLVDGNYGPQIQSWESVLTIAGRPPIATWLVRRLSMSPSQVVLELRTSRGAAIGTAVWNNPLPPLDRAPTPAEAATLYSPDVTPANRFARRLAHFPPLKPTDWVERAGYIVQLEAGDPVRMWIQFDPFYVDSPGLVMLTGTPDAALLRGRGLFPNSVSRWFTLPSNAITEEAGGASSKPATVALISRYLQGGPFGVILRWHAAPDVPVAALSQRQPDALILLPLVAGTGRAHR